MKELIKNDHGQLKQLAADNGIFLASTQWLYEAMAKNELSCFSVPAFNLRVLTFDLAKAAFRAAKKTKTAAFIFEIAQSEMAYTNQSPKEYAATILAAAIDEKWLGPVFIQGDHFKIKNETYFNNQAEEILKIKNLIKEAIQAGFYNIDIDCSNLPLQNNFIETANLITFIRQNQPDNITITIGGEIGEIGGNNTNLIQTEEFLKGLEQELKQNKTFPGISKLAIQSGTSHGQGGEVDFKLLRQLSAKAKEYGLAGVVQHGASTLPKKLFKKFPKFGVCEIHLATELMNIVLESRSFPKELREKIKTKHDLGENKEAILAMPQESIDKIAEEVEDEFKFFFKALAVKNSQRIIKQLY